MAWAIMDSRGNYYRSKRAEMTWRLDSAKLYQNETVAKKRMDKIVKYAVENHFKILPICLIEVNVVEK